MRHRPLTAGTLLLRPGAEDAAARSRVGRTQYLTDDSMLSDGGSTNAVGR